MSKVWFQPTRHSPACEFNVPQKAQKVLSTCGMWNCVVFPGISAPAAPGKNTCPLCIAGERATGNLGVAGKGEA